MLTRGLCLLLSLSYVIIAGADYLPRERAVPGGIAHISINLANEPTVYFQEHRVAMARLNNTEKQTIHSWIAVTGISLTTPPGEYMLQIAAPLREQILFTVNPKDYPEESIIIPDNHIIYASLENATRIGEDQKILKKALSHWSDKNPFIDAFTAPIQGRISGYFGTVRDVNNSWHIPHTGLDIAAPAGTPILAPISGIVLATHDFLFYGNTVILDHGQGLITLYAHLQEVDVKEGDYVAQSKKIGTVGQTGRATGPHLHWSIALNQTLVDPLLFINHKELIHSIVVEETT